MHKWIWSISTFLFAVVPALATQQLVLKEVEPKFAETAFITELTFSAPINTDKLSVQYINQTIQVDIPNGYLPSGKLTKDLEHSRIKSVFTYQVKPKTLRTRIIHHKPIAAKDLRKATYLFSEGNKLLVVVDEVGQYVATRKQSSVADVRPVDLTEELDEAISAISVPTELPEKQSAAEIVSRELKSDNTEIAKESKAQKKDLPESQIPVFKNKEEAVKVGSSGLYMRLVISLAVILILAGGITYFAKWWKKNSNKSLNNNEISVMTQHHLGPRKSLAIVRVAGEYILIGVTDHNISMIKSLALIDDEYGDDSPPKFSDLVPDEKPEVNATKEPEGVSLASVKDVVASRLKDMRQI